MQGNGIFSNLTFSEKRKIILFLLLEKPCTLQEINEHLSVKSPESQPRIKEMESVGLVVKDEDVYKLTVLGKIAAMNYKPFLDTIEAIERNKDFWEKHDLSVLPDKFLYDLKKLKSCSVVSSKNFKIGESHPEFIRNVNVAKKIKGVTSVINSGWAGTFIDLARKNAHIEIIVTMDVYEDILKECPDKLEKLLSNKNVHIYVCDDDIKIAFAAMQGDGGPFLSLGLYNKNTHCYDNTNDLEGNDYESMKWGEELFEYYKESSVEIEMMPEQNEYLNCENDHDVVELNSI